MLLLIFGVFMIHALSWLIRSTLQTLIYGRHRRLAESELAIKRPDVGPRVTYISLLISFPGLALTGLPLKYSELADQASWAHMRLLLEDVFGD